MTQIMTTHGIGRPLSEAQRGHLTALIAAMNVAQVRLEAARSVAQAQQDAAQSAYDSAQAQAQAFLNYCGAELGCTFSDGDWKFDQQIMAFVRVEAPEADIMAAFEPELHEKREYGVTSYIRDLTELTTVANNDYLLISDTSDVVNRDKRISQANLLATAISGSGLVATGGFTLTVPATGTAALLGTAQTFSALNTFSAGLRLGAGPTTLSWYEEGTWTPALTFGGLAAGLTYASQQGYFTRIGNLVAAWGTISLSAVGTSTGAAAIGGLPYALSNFANFRPSVSLYSASMSYTGVMQAPLVNNSTSISLLALNGGVATGLTNTAFTSSTLIGITAVYRTG